MTWVSRLSFYLGILQNFKWPGKSTAENPHLKLKVSYLREQDLITLHKSEVPVSLHTCIHAEKLMLPKHHFPEKRGNILFSVLCISQMVCRDNITHCCDETWQLLNTRQLQMRSGKENYPGSHWVSVTPMKHHSSYSLFKQIETGMSSKPLYTKLEKKL